MVDIVVAYFLLLYNPYKDQSKSQKIVFQIQTAEEKYFDVFDLLAIFALTELIPHPIQVFLLDSL